jgi:O-antigen/teichoic acid export membrane protein
MFTVLRKVPTAQLWTRLFTDSSLTKKAYLNAVAAALDYGARLLIGFLLTPLLVAGLGDYLFGVWKVLSSVTGYLTAASGRPTQTLKFTLANLQTSTDFTEKRRQVGSAVLVWLVFCPLLLTLGGLLIWLLPQWLSLPPDLVWITRLATGVLVLQMTLLSLVDIPQAIMEGENIGYKRMGLSALLVLIGGIFTALALYFNARIVGVALATLVTTVLTGVLYLRVTHSYVPWLGIAKPARSALQRFVGLSWWFLLWRLVMQFMLASDSALLGIFASVELVTSYSLMKYLPETLVNLVAIVAFGIAPGLGGIIGAGDLAKASKVRSEIQLFAWFTATVIGSLTLLWNDDFLNLWVGAGYHVGALENLLLMIMMMQFVLIRNDGNFIDLTLNPRKKVLLGVLSVILSTGCALLFMRLFASNIVGLCLGIIAGRLLLSISYPMIIGQFLEIPLWQQLKGSCYRSALCWDGAAGFAAHPVEQCYRK